MLRFIDNTQCCSIQRLLKINLEEEKSKGWIWNNLIYDALLSIDVVNFENISYMNRINDSINWKVIFEWIGKKTLNYSDHNKTCCHRNRSLFIDWWLFTDSIDSPPFFCGYRENRLHIRKQIYFYFWHESIFIRKISNG